MGTSTIDFSKYEEKPQIDFSKYESGMSPHLREIIRDNPPNFPQASLNEAALSGMTGMPLPSFSLQQRKEFEEGKTAGGMATPGGGLITAGSGVGDVAQGHYARGGSKIIRGTLTAAAPLVPEAVIARPIMALRAFAGGYIGSQLAETGAKQFGADTEQKQFAGDIGNLLGGFTAASGLPRAFLETPVKNLAKNPALMKAVLKVLEPKKALVEALKSGLKDAIEEPTGVTEATAAGPVPADTAPVKPSAVPETKLPNATYLRSDVRSLSQQPPAASKPDLLSGIREHEFLMKVQDELNRQGGDEQAQAEINKWIEAHNQKAPGAKPSAAATTKAKFEQMRAQAEGKANAVPVDEPTQGGHAGGGVSSVEELNRPGANYVVTRGGNLTYHGKAFAPEATPSGASHVTVLKDGTFQVNAGPKLNPSQEMSLRMATMKKGPQPETPISDEHLADILRRSLEKMRAAKAGDD
jgi:hypothetical protein